MKSENYRKCLLVCLNAAHAIELRAAAGVPRVSCCLSTISSLSLLCGFALLPPPLSWTSLELWRPCTEAAACRDCLTAISPSALGLPQAPVPHFSGTFLVLSTWENNRMFVCVLPLLYWDHLEGHLCSPAPRIVLGNVDIQACSHTLHLETYS